ncbi:MAG TPA: hypothetical protein VMU37_02475, partial [Caulobacteraceae bacterium]|nr:hypothetical protein [Caulobacteraceae bacterium]
WLAVTVNAFSALLGALVTPVMMAAVYNLAKASPDPFRFHIVSEGAWDVGCGSGLIAAAILAALGGPLAIAILLAIPAAVATAWLLWRYYGAHPEAANDAPIEAELTPILAESHAPP